MSVTVAFIASSTLKCTLNVIPAGTNPTSIAMCSVTQTDRGVSATTFSLTSSTFTPNRASDSRES